MLPQVCQESNFNIKANIKIIKVSIFVFLNQSCLDVLAALYRFGPSSANGRRGFKEVMAFFLKSLAIIAQWKLVVSLAPGAMELRHGFCVGLTFLESWLLDIVFGVSDESSCQLLVGLLFG